MCKVIECCEWLIVELIELYVSTCLPKLKEYDIVTVTYLYYIHAHQTHTCIHAHQTKEYVTDCIHAHQMNLMKDGVTMGMYTGIVNIANVYQISKEFLSVFGVTVV